MVVGIFLAGCGASNESSHSQQLPAIDLQNNVWFCVSISAEREHYPCFDAIEQCEEDRAEALVMNAKVGKCKQHPSAYCYRAIKNHKYNDLCSRTLKLCEVERHGVYTKEGAEVTDCIRIPPKSSHRLRRSRRWRTARRR